MYTHIDSAHRRQCDAAASTRRRRPPPIGTQAPPERYYILSKSPSLSPSI